MSKEAIPAATLIVVRDRAGKAPELLIVERAGGMAFAAGALVFPGGRIDARDRDLGGADSARIAAIRETIEETAIPVAIAPLPDSDQAAEMQAALVAERPFADMLRDHGLTLDLRALTPFARWVPKFHAVRRFDTMFYAARAPAGPWQPQVIEGECSGAYWLSAKAVLDMEKSGDARLIFPTRRTLERLAQHDSFDAICADASAHPIEPVTPWLEHRGDQQFITIPDHLGYPVTAELFEGQWRG
ncbi:MAG: NUDIX domain-containing protein [Sphingomicrobium sp.]